MRNGEAKRIALGGILAAAAMVIMCMVGLIPMATFVCPVLCMAILQFVKTFTSNRIGWAWYCAVAFMSLFMAPDKESALVFLFLGYYPLIKPKFDSWKLGILCKFALFNCAILLLYGVCIRIFGMAQILSELREMGTALLWITLALGNLTFLFLDFALGNLNKRRRRK